MATSREATWIAGGPWRDPERQAKLENDEPLAGDTAELLWQIPEKQPIIYWNQSYTEGTHYAHQSEYALIAIGRVPDARGIRLQTTGEGMVRVNGKPILHLPGANYSAGPHLDRPVETTSHEADLTPYAGQHVIIEFSSDGAGWKPYRRPAPWRSLHRDMTDEAKKNFEIRTHITTVDGAEWWLKGWWSPRIVVDR